MTAPVQQLVNLADTEAQAGTVPKQTWAQANPVVASFAASGAAVGTGVVLTNWVDVIKVRQQLAGPAAARNLAATGWQIVRHEGVLALGQGITPAVARGVLYGGLRIGLYAPMKALLGAEGKDSSIVAKIAAGMLSGALAAGISNPTDLVKTHMQKGGGSAGGPFAVMAQVVRSEGVRGLWVGTTPSMARAALLTASQCATYDELKLLFVRQLGWEDNLQTHFAVSGLAGLVTTTVTAPVDMIKTNLFVNRHLYATPAQCLQHIMKEQGLRGFFRGWGAMWARQGPMTTCIFVINEWLRGSMGLATL